MVYETNKLLINLQGVCLHLQIGNQLITEVATSIILTRKTVMHFPTFNMLEICFNPHARFSFALLDFSLINVKDKLGALASTNVYQTHSVNKYSNLLLLLEKFSGRLEKFEPRIETSDNY